MQIGLAEVDITPALGTVMSGFFETRRVRALHDPLFARAMVLDNGSHPLMLITCDVLALRRTTVNEAKARIQAATGLGPESIMLSATHTHTAAAAASLFTYEPDPDYLVRLADGILKAAQGAWESRRPATLGIGWGFEGRLSHNRRFMMRSTKQVVMHPPKGSTDILYQEGKVDPEVGVLSARAADGTPLGCLLNFACHVNTVGGDEVSADYPGQFAAAMKRGQGESHVGLFANGCCGNLCAIDVYDPDRPDAGHDWARQMGEKLAEDVVRIEAETEYVDEMLFDARLVEISLPMRRISPELLEWARGVLAAPDGNSLYESTYAAQTVQMVERYRLNPMVTAPVQAFRLGSVGIVMLPGEIFVEFGLDIKLNSPAERTFVVELANGIVGYVPTREAFAGGGYEQRTAMSSRLCPGAGETLVDTALALLDSMFV